ncbi:MATE family efflux transporter [Zavarzinella formosa]|uniref:MATE family efflux transporter n=1 Tax=Zavarzinella formosa TaxID=360055 RepID=UPI0002DE280E|nr:MATE family efflux transporter [Zavarzinella formosa]
MTDQNIDTPVIDSPSQDVSTAPPPAPATLRGLLTMAWPLIISNSFSTIQITIDRLFLSGQGIDVASGATSAAMIFWLPYILLFSTAAYVATFVAQYTGAKRPHRVGSAVWQGIWFSVVAGIAFLGFIPLADGLFALIGHSPEIQYYEAEYFRCMCWFALPGLFVSSISAFFSGRGESQVVILISIPGTLVNSVLAYAWIPGHWGFPSMGITGAGYAAVAGGWASALTAFALFMRKRYRVSNSTLIGWKPDFSLLFRLMRFGLPSALHWTLEMTAFNAFVILTGWFGTDDLNATNLAITINNVAFIPMMGMGMAVSILVGQCLGENNPKAAEKLTWMGVAVAGTYMLTIGLMYVVVPSLFIGPFQGDNPPERWALIAERTQILLLFVAGFALFDAINLVVSFGLRGAGDTLFVSAVSLCFAWPVMVIPSYVVYRLGWSHGLFWAWGFASLYIGLQSLCFVVRFRGGKWKSMRVIEPEVIDPLDKELAASETNANGEIVGTATETL